MTIKSTQPEIDARESQPTVQSGPEPPSRACSFRRILITLALIFAVGVGVVFFWPPSSPKEASSVGPPAISGEPTTAPAISEVSAMTWEDTYVPRVIAPIVPATAVDPRDEETVFIGTLGQGLYLTRDGGRSWTQVADELLADSDVLDIVFDLSPMGRVYVLTDFGVVATPDRGISWEDVSSSLSREIQPWSIGVAQDTHGTVYVGTRRHGVLVSQDRGRNWESARAEGLPSEPITAIAIAPSDPSVVYIGTSQGNVAVTRNGGATWQLVSRGVPAEARVSGIVVDPRDANVVLLGTWEFGAYKTLDGGESWRKLELYESGFPALGLDPLNPDHVLAGPGWFGVWRSRDQGDSWQEPSDRDIHVTERSIASISWSVSEPRVVYAAADDRSGVFVSRDGGETWGSLTRNIWGHRLGAIDIDPEGILVGAFDGLGLRIGEKGSTTLTDYPIGLEGDYVFTSIVPSSIENAIWYVTTMNSGVIRIDLPHRVAIPIGLETETVTSLVLHPSKAESMLALTHRGLRRTSDGGETWTMVGHIETGSCTPTVGDLLFASQVTPDLVVAATCEGVFYSDDFGLNWDQVMEPPESGIHFISVAEEPYSPNTVYLGSDAGSLFVFQRESEGWKVLSYWIPGAANVSGLAASPLDTSEFHILYAVTDLGLFRSFDKGRSWKLEHTPDTSEELFERVLVDPSEPGRVFVSSASGTVRQLLDLVAVGHDRLRGSVRGTPPRHGVVKWTTIPTPDDAVTALAVSNDRESVLYAGTENGRIYRSSDEGLSWLPVYTPVATAPAIVRISALPGQRVAAIKETGETLVSVDGGSNWEPGEVLLARRLERPPETINTIDVWATQTGAPSYYATDSGVYKLRLDGHVVRVNYGLPVRLGSPEIRRIVGAVDDPDLVYAVVSVPFVRRYSTYIGVFRTANGGGNWNLVDSGLPRGFEVLDIAVSPHDPDKLFVSVLGHGLYSGTVQQLPPALLLVVGKAFIGIAILLAVASSQVRSVMLSAVLASRRTPIERAKVLLCWHPIPTVVGAVMAAGAGLAILWVVLPALPPLLRSRAPLTYHEAYAFFNRLNSGPVYVGDEASLDVTLVFGASLHALLAVAIASGIGLSLTHKVSLGKAIRGTFAVCSSVFMLLSLCLSMGVVIASVLPQATRVLLSLGNPVHSATLFEYAMFALPALCLGIALIPPAFPSSSHLRAVGLALAVLASYEWALERAYLRFIEPNVISLIAKNAIGRFLIAPAYAKGFAVGFAGVYGVYVMMKSVRKVVPDLRAACMAIVKAVASKWRAVVEYVRQWLYSRRLDLVLLAAKGLQLVGREWESGELYVYVIEEAIESSRWNLVAQAIPELGEIDCSRAIEHIAGLLAGEPEELSEYVARRWTAIRAAGEVLRVHTSEAVLIIDIVASFGSGAALMKDVMAMASQWYLDRLTDAYVALAMATSSTEVARALKTLTRQLSALAADGEAQGGPPARLGLARDQLEALIAVYAAVRTSLAARNLLRVNTRAVISSLAEVDFASQPHSRFLAMLRSLYEVADEVTRIRKAKVAEEMQVETLLDAVVRLRTVKQDAAGRLIPQHDRLLMLVAAKWERQVLPLLGQKR